MKIIAIKRGFAGNKVQLLGKEISFNIAGEAEVPDVLGEELLKKYTSMLAIPGQEKKVEKEPVKQIRKTDEEERLEGLLAKYSAIIESLKKDIADVKASEQAWKDTYSKVNEKYEALKKSFGSAPEAPQREEPEDLESLIESSTFGKLKVICKEMSYPEEEWKGLKNRDELKEYIRTKYANA